MYCKNCGKIIADDSHFCKYCGTLVDVLSEINNSNRTPKSGSEIVVTTKEESPLKIEIAKKTNIKNSIIADEIIANVKMLVIAFAIWIIYIVGFYAIHQEDIKPMDENSWFGESCYDPSSLSGYWRMDWQTQYAFKVLEAPDYSRIKDHKGDVFYSIRPNIISPYDYSYVMGMSAEKALNYANSKAKDKQLSKKEQEILKAEAIEDAKKDRESFWETIDEYRQTGFRNDLHKNMTYAAIIIISVCILGRYIIKFCKWIKHSKTK